MRRRRAGRHVVQRLYASTQTVAGLQQRHVDIVDKIEIAVRVDAMLHHQSAKCGAIFAPIIVADLVCAFAVNLEIILDIGGYPIAHLLHDIMLRRIKRQIKIKYPCFHMAEVRMDRRRHRRPVNYRCQISQGTTALMLAQATRS